MKKKIFFSILMIAVTTTVLFIKLNADIGTFSSTQVSPSDTAFLLSVFDNGKDVKYYRLRDSLHLNGWHTYGSWEELIGCKDDIETEPSVYFTPAQTYIGQTNDSGLLTIMTRPKFWYLGNCQRSDYQAEPLTQNDDYWFYSYSNHGSFATPYDDGDGTKGMRCTPTSTYQCGHIVSGLLSNREQVNRNTYEEAMDGNTDWYIMPRIKINRDDVNTSKKVCRIDLFNAKGDLIDSIKIITDYFKKDAYPYTGQYIDSFYFPFDVNLLKKDGLSFNPDPNPITVNSTNCGVDFKVWWYGDVEMWIDRIRVEDKKAHFMLSEHPGDPLYDKFQNWLHWEIQFAKNNPGKIYKYYIDEVEFNTLPGLKYINHKIDSATNHNSGLMVVLNYDLFKVHKPGGDNSTMSAAEIRKYMIDDAGLNNLLFGQYPFTGYANNGALPNTLPIGSHLYDMNNGILADATFIPEDYETWLQDFMDLHFTFRYLDMLKTANSVAYNYTPNVPFIAYVQAHSFKYYDVMNREPTNEELSMLSYLPISYGAKGLMFFSHHGFGSFDCDYWVRGLTNPPNKNCPSPEPKRLYTDSWERIPRHLNAYGQQKWNHFRGITNKIKQWGHLLMSFNSGLSKSYIFRDATERTLLFQNSYFSDIKTFPSTNDTNTVSSTYDIADETYLQAATFKNNEPNTNYFMIINRRCAPFYQYNQDLGGRRYIKVKFDATNLDGFNNWILTDVTTNTNIITFDKNNCGYLDIGWFRPGEANIYKLTPVMQEGGSLVCDENVSGVSFICKGMVYSIGKNITIGDRTQITFKPNAGINMLDASFSCTYSDGPNNNYIYLKPETNSYWQGLSFYLCNISISNATIINNNAPNPIYTISGTNCMATNISNSAFTITGNAGTINFISNLNWDDGETVYNDYLTNNIFNAQGNNNPVIEYLCMDGLVRSAYISGNQFNSTNNSGGTALYLKSYLGLIESNNFSEFNSGVHLSASSISFISNIFQNNTSGNNAIRGDALSFAGLGKDGNTITGGSNTLTVAGSNANILEIYNASFNLSNGNNIFNLTDENAFDVYGYSPEDPFGSNSIDATYNCFYLSYDIFTRTNYTNGPTVNQYSFIYNTNECLAYQLTPDFVTILDYNIIDTVFKVSNAPENLTPVEQLIKNVNVDYRKAEFDDVKQNCELLLTNYTDSIAANDIIAKLYSSTINIDINGQLTQNLKSLFEQMIIQHPDKTDLIKCAFYYIQKCKVVNEDYLSALQGFQQIMQQNPYDYLGLVASWDYASTLLLMDTTGGTGGSEQELYFVSDGNYAKNLEYYFEHFDLQGYDSLKFTKDDRKIIKETLKKTFTDTRKQQTTKFDEAKKLSEKGDDKAKQQVTKMKTLNETVKIKKPKDHSELRSIMQSDIAKVFGNGKPGNSNNENSIPTTYSLSQNYPNPFNPNTKINYELPKDGKVKIVIYDILGRQIKTLVNNEFKQAGRYTVEFNGSQYASGVYFYRIQIEGGTSAVADGKGYTAVKKMLLIK